MPGGSPWSPHRFDALTRALSIPGSRRRTLATLLGSALGLLTSGAGPSDEAVAKQHKRAKRRTKREVTAEGPCGHGSARKNRCKRDRQGCTHSGKKQRCRCRKAGHTWLAGLIRTRRECGEIGAGRSQVLETGHDAVLGLRYDDNESAIVVLNNLSRQRHTVTLDLTERELATATDLFGDRQYRPINPESRQTRLEGFGYRWLRLGGAY